MYKRQILHNVSLYARPGQKIAFVGATGAGDVYKRQPMMRPAVMTPHSTASTLGQNLRSNSVAARQPVHRCV